MIRSRPSWSSPSPGRRRALTRPAGALSRPTGEGWGEGRFPRWWTLLGALTLHLVCCLPGSGASSADYTLLHSTWDVGGGVAVSGHYRLVSSVGLPGGLTRSADGWISNRLGFVGLLNDPPVLRAYTARSGADFFAKVRVTSLLGGAQDPEGDGLALQRFELVTSAGGRVSLEGDWLLYEPPTSFPGLDSFHYAVEDTAGNVALGLVTVLVAEPGLSPSQNLIAVAVLPNGHTYIAFAGIARRTYAIEWSDQLPAIRWESLASAVADSQGLIEWVDATDPAPPQRYYRTRSP